MYTLAKKSRLYWGGATGYGEFHTVEEARAAAPNNPVGYDVYEVVDYSPVPKEAVDESKMQRERSERLRDRRANLRG